MTQQQWMEVQLDEARRVQEAVREMTPLLIGLAGRMAEVFQKGGRVYFFGNGGSAADAQHWAAELAGRFYQNRPSLPAIALTTNASLITALANDFSYDDIFAHQLLGLVKPQDMTVGISTSGQSPNVLRGLAAARERGAVTIGFTGGEGGRMLDCCEMMVCIPSTDVARIQEGHALCGHLVCALVERMIFGATS